LTLTIFHDPFKIADTVLSTSTPPAPWSGSGRVVHSKCRSPSMMCVRVCVLCSVHAWNPIVYVLFIYRRKNIEFSDRPAVGERRGRADGSFFGAHAIIAATAALQARGQYSRPRMTLMANIETMCPPSSPASGRPDGPEPV